MKKVLVTGAFIFSVALNVAVACTLGWLLLLDRRPIWSATPVAPYLAEEDIRTIKKLWPREMRGLMMEKRDKILQKKGEIIDLIAKNPDNLAVADKAIQELAALDAEVTRDSVRRLSAIVASLPEERRNAFCAFLKSRACMGPGFSIQRGRHHRWGRHDRSGMGPCPIDSE